MISLFGDFENYKTFHNYDHTELKEMKRGSSDHAFMREDIQTLW